MKNIYLVLAAPVLVCAIHAWAGQPVDELMPKLKTEIKEEGDLKLDWAWQTYVTGPMFFLSVHHSGTINSFSRDEKTGDLKFLNSVNVATELQRTGTHVDLNYTVSNKNILYVGGAWTHAHGDEHSIGLRWYKVDPKNGSFTKLGELPCIAVAGMVPSSNPNLFYLCAQFAHCVIEVNLDPADGKPTLGNKIVGKGIGGGMVPSPDGMHFYSVSAEGIGWLNSDKDGKLAYASSVEIPDLPSSADSNNLFVSPDGKHVYFCTRYDYGKPGGSKSFGAIFKRDANTGALTFAEKMEISKLGGLARMAFTSDGRIGYFCGGPESPAAGLGYYKRDPETGRLTFGGKAAGGNPTWFFTYTPDTNTIYLSGFWSTKTFKIFSVPQDAGALKPQALTDKQVRK
ncbi:MAG: beta-propeller fold lactonase family protein [Planctomycetes bacterium]|nr:beta-propeller fold lactonase family protein [Planctomycetota bacterium]